MLRFKYYILAAIAALMVTSCEKNVQMITEINRDVSCTRVYSIKESDNVYADETWVEDTSDTVRTTIYRTFNSVEEMAANPVLAVNGEYINSQAQLDKKFKWFYTDYTFSETFASKEHFLNVPWTDKMSRDELSFMLTGYPNLTEGMTGEEIVQFMDPLQEKFEYLTYLSVIDCDLRLIANHYGIIANPPVDRTTFMSLRDSITRYALDEDWDILRHRKGLIQEYFKSDAYSIFYDSDDDIKDEFEDEYEDYLNFVDLYYLITPYSLKMPGRVIETGRGTLKDGVINYHFGGKFLLVGDYTITASSRVTNVWAFILSGLIILLAVASLLYRRK